MQASKQNSMNVNRNAKKARLPPPPPPRSSSLSSRSRSSSLNVQSATVLDLPPPPTAASASASTSTSTSAHSILYLSEQHEVSDRNSAGRKRVGFAEDTKEESDVVSSRSRVPASRRKVQSMDLRNAIRNTSQPRETPSFQETSRESSSISDALFTCSACSMPILDYGVTAFGNVFHRKCFMCSRCSKLLAEGTSDGKYYRNNGKAFCSECYSSSNSSRRMCSKCKKPIHSSQKCILDDTGKVMHNDCFACANCKSVITGQHGVLGSDVYCVSCLNKPLVVLRLLREQQLAKKRAGN